MFRNPRRFNQPLLEMPCIPSSFSLAMSRRQSSSISTVDCFSGARADNLIASFQHRQLKAYSYDSPLRAVPPCFEFCLHIPSSDLRHCHSLQLFTMVNSASNIVISGDSAGSSDVIALLRYLSSVDGNSLPSPLAVLHSSPLETLPHSAIPAGSHSFAE